MQAAPELHPVTERPIHQSAFGPIRLLFPEEARHSPPRGPDKACLC